MKFITVFHCLHDYHLNKDVGIIPLTISKIYGEKSTIICWSEKSQTNIESFSNEQLSIKSICANNFFVFIFKVLCFLSIEKPSIINTYHLNKYSIFYYFISIFVGSKYYLKLDMSEVMIDELESILSRNRFRRFVYDFFIHRFHYITVEQRKIFSRLEKIFFQLKNLHCVPDSILKETIPKISSVDRENIIIIVGRIGAYQKNHELILNAINQVGSLKDWVIYFVGTYEEEVKTKFVRTIDSRFRGNITFTGALDRESLFSLYARSKVFILSSRWEAFSIALLEAAYMGCFIVGTNVGGVEQLTNCGNFGEIFSSELDLVNILNVIINGNFDFYENYMERCEFVRKNFDARKNIGSLFF